MAGLEEQPQQQQTGVEADHRRAEGEEQLEEQEHQAAAAAAAARPNAAVAACITYVPDFLTQEQADQLRRDVDSARGWQVLSGRRLLSLGGLVTAGGLVPAPLPRWLPPLMARAAARAGFCPHAPPNHALVNLYRPGEGILPHEDGPAYEPRVAIASIGSPARGAPVPGVHPPDASVLLEPRSLVVFEGEAYSGCYHGIEACEVEAIDGSVRNPPAQAAAAAATPGAAVGVVPRDGDRVSFTIRRVSRVRPLLRLAPR